MSSQNTSEVTEFDSIRHAIKELQLKDAVTRQSLMKSQRVQSDLNSEIEKLSSEIQKLEKEISQDERLLLKQEEDIVKVKTASLRQPKNCSQLESAINRHKEWHKSLKDRHEDEKAMYRKINSSMQRILKTPGDLELIKDAINSFEELTQQKDYILRFEEKASSLQLEYLENHRKALEEEYQQINDGRVKDLQKMYHLEKAISMYEGATEPCFGTEDQETQNEAVEAAQEILGRLRLKLGSSQDSQPFLSQLNRKITKSKVSQ